MSSPFIGQIQPFGFPFAPRNWALCDGQLIAILQNTALFALVGQTYGGDGRSTFALPDLRGRSPIHVGTGPGLTPRSWAERGGVEQVFLNAAELPSHSHTVNAVQAPGNQLVPNSAFPAGDSSTQDRVYSSTLTSPTTLNAGSIGQQGGGQSHDNMPPFLVINWCIALFGIFPSRS